MLPERHLRAGMLKVRNDRHCAISIMFYDSNKEVEQWTLDAEVAGADKSCQTPKVHRNCCVNGWLRKRAEDRRHPDL